LLSSRSIKETELVSESRFLRAPNESPEEDFLDRDDLEEDDEFTAEDLARIEALRMDEL
jgi:hypothetical protein